MRFYRQSTFSRLVLGAAIAAVIASAACAVKGRTLEGISADYSVQVGKSVAVAQEAVGTFGKASADPKVRNASVLALKGLDVVNVNGLELADLLDKIVALRRASSRRRWRWLMRSTARSTSTSFRILAMPQRPGRLSRRRGRCRSSCSASSSSSDS